MQLTRLRLWVPRSVYSRPVRSFSQDMTSPFYIDLLSSAIYDVRTIRYSESAYSTFSKSLRGLKLKACRYLVSATMIVVYEHGNSSYRWSMHLSDCKPSDHNWRRGIVLCQLIWGWLIFIRSFQWELIVNDFCSFSLAVKELYTLVRRKLRGQLENVCSLWCVIPLPRCDAFPTQESIMWIESVLCSVYCHVSFIAMCPTLRLSLLKTTACK